VRGAYSRQATSGKPTQPPRPGAGPSLSPPQRGREGVTMQERLALHQPEGSATRRKTRARNKCLKSVISGLTPRRHAENPPSAGSLRRTGDQKLAMGPIVQRQGECQKASPRSRPADPGRVYASSQIKGARRDRPRPPRGAVKTGEWARTTTRQKHAPNVACATVIVRRTKAATPPRYSNPDGQRGACKDSPRMTLRARRAGSRPDKPEEEGVRENGKRDM